MRYIQVAGFMANKISTNNNWVGSPGFDIERMEAEEVSGFDFELPVHLFPKSYQADDFQMRLVIDVGPTDTVFTFDYIDGSLSVGSRLWIKNEVIEIVSFTTAYTLVAIRGVNNTFAQKYSLPVDSVDAEQYYHARRYSKTFIGQRVFLYEDDKIISIGLIKSQPVFNSTMLEFNCDNALSVLDIPFNFNDAEWGLGDLLGLGEGVSSYAFGSILARIYGSSNYRTEIPPILDYMVSGGQLFSGGIGANEFIAYSELPSMLEALNLFGKLNARVFTWDYSTQKFNFISVSDITTLDTVVDRNLSPYVDTSKSYQSELYTGISQISLKLPQTTINLNNPNIMQFAEKKLFEIDLTFFDERSSFSDITDIALYYLRLFTIIYSKLTIPTHPVKYPDFTEGQFYNILDIDKFYTFQDVSQKAFCLAKDEDSITFLVTREVEKSPVAPGITGQIVNLANFKHDDNLGDLLDSDAEQIADAKIEQYDYKYFETGDKVMMISNAGARISGLTIGAIVGDEITLLGYTFAGNEVGYLTYDIYSACVIRQKIFFFLNNSEW